MLKKKNQRIQSLIFQKNYRILISKREEQHGHFTVCAPFSRGSLSTFLQLGHLRYTCVFLSRRLFLRSLKNPRILPVILRYASFSFARAVIFFESILKRVYITSALSIIVSARSSQKRFATKITSDEIHKARDSSSYPRLPYIKRAILSLNVCLIPFRLSKSLL